MASTLCAAAVLAGAAGASPAFAQGRTGSLSGVGTAAGVVAGRVIAPAGGPAQGIAVTVGGPNASAWYATTAADGTYSVTLPPGTAYVVTFTNGRLSQHSPRALDWEQARQYTVRSGRTTRINERLLAPATLTGRLLDTSGAPVDGAQVHLEILGTASSASTSTGPDGRYLLEKLPPGDVKVGFSTSDGWQQWADRRATVDEADAITLSLGTVTTVDQRFTPLAAPATLTGRLLDTSGTPVAGAQVQLLFLDTAGQKSTSTGPDGRYLFDKLPASDNAVVGFIAPDGREQWAHQKATYAEATLITLTRATVTTVDETLLPLATRTARP